MKLVGYSDALSVESGQDITFMVSSELSTYRADIVRLIHGHDAPEGPGRKVLKVASEISGKYQGRRQLLRPGSYIRVATAPQLPDSGSFSVHLWIQPTMAGDATQTLVSSSGPHGLTFAVRIVDGQLGLQLGPDPTNAVRLTEKIRDGLWYSVFVAYDGQRDEARLSLQSLELSASHRTWSAVVPITAAPTNAAFEILIAGEAVREDGHQVVGNLYNGKLEAPAIYGHVLTEAEADSVRSAGAASVSGLLAAWDLATDIQSAVTKDLTGNGHDGQVINRPTRATPGHNWNGSELVWHQAPEQFAAAHFHQDDLDDAGWEPTIRWHVPAGTPSGVYALHLHAPGEQQEDFVPFVIRPKRGTATAEVAFLLPTFSYLAYGNEHLASIPQLQQMREAMGLSGFEWPSHANDKYIVANQLNSMYDTHVDGSGSHFASWRRPLVTMRPNHANTSLGMSIPSQLNWDLMIVDWLFEQGYDVDVIEDTNLHQEGVELLGNYKVLITGAHPEYCSEQMIRALHEFLSAGGRVMYLGGNGFYWVTQLDPVSGHTVEMRRAQPSSPRLFEPHPGEEHLTTTGQRGTIWRFRGLPSQEWLGVVFTAGGVGTGQHYVRQPGSFDERASWIFDGLADDELIGDFDNLNGFYGAAGIEVDRVDFDVPGTPRHAVVLATTPPFGPNYFATPEQPLTDPAAQIRSDLCLLEYPNGGAAFSASSIAWASCLSHNDYSNSVSRLTRNVLDGFLKQG